MKVDIVRCLSIGSDAAHAHSMQPVDDLQRAEVLPTMPPAAELVLPPLRANLPKAGIVNGGAPKNHSRSLKTTLAHFSLLWYEDTRELSF